jgi:hypothetical protein
MEKFVLLFATTVLGATAFASSEMELKRILLIGKTGSGKTSLVQMAHEHCRGGNYESERDFIVPLVVGDTNIGLPQDQVVSATHSQTKEMTVYRVFDPSLQMPVELVDTQGLFDTEGASLLEARKELSDYLAQNPVHGIALVIPGSDARVTQQIQDMLALLDGIFGDSRVKDNFLALVTFSSLANQNINLLLKEHVTDVSSKIFYFDNSCVVPGKPHDTQGNEFHSLIWKNHQRNFTAFLETLSQLKPLESLIFQERSKLLLEAEELIKEFHHIEKKIPELEREMATLAEDLNLIGAHHYKKWNCGHVGENLSINTTSTPVFGEKRQGGIGGMFGGTKTFISGYNTTHSCGRCGGLPAHHSHQEYVNLRGQGETLMASTLGETNQKKADFEQEKREELERIERIELRLHAINGELNGVGSKRDYILDLRQQLSLKS